VAHGSHLRPNAYLNVWLVVALAEKTQSLASTLARFLRTQLACRINASATTAMPYLLDHHFV
jgi:hypothetical protein